MPVHPASDFLLYFLKHKITISVARDLLGLGLFPVTQHSAWIVKIMQSLFLMITFFFHVFR